MALVDWLPSPADVGDILHTRTKDRFGNVLGTFTENTRPTDAQVASVIDSVVSDIESQTGTIPEDLQPFARRVAAIGSAALVELSYFPEQIRTDQSPYEELKKWYDDAFKRLVSEANDVNAGGEVGGGSSGDGVSSASPSFGFPDGSWMVGLSRRL